MREIDALEVGALSGVLEALLLVATDPVTAKELAAAAEVDEAEVKAALTELSEAYRDQNRGMQLREVAGGWRLFTHPAYHAQVEAFVRSFDRRRLSQAALETLAVIAYLQPVTREGVRAVRGVNSDGVIASLRDKGLVRESGRDERRSALFSTTTSFLESFGLRSAADLPPLEDFAAGEEEREFIRERLSGRTSASIEETADELEQAADELEEEREIAAEADAWEAPAAESGEGEL